MRTKMFSVAAALSAGALMLAACSSSEGGTEPQENGSSSSVKTDTVIDQFGEVRKTIGPNGEEPTPSEELVLTEAEQEEIRNGGYRAAISWHEQSNYSQALQAGMEEVFEELGIEVVSVTDASFDAAVQADQILSAVALNPDVIL